MFRRKNAGTAATNDQDKRPPRAATALQDVAGSRQAVRRRRTGRGCHPRHRRLGYASCLEQSLTSAGLRVLDIDPVRRDVLSVPEGVGTGCVRPVRYR